MTVRKRWLARAGVLALFLVGLATANDTSVSAAGTKWFSPRHGSVTTTPESYHLCGTWVTNQFNWRDAWEGELRGVTDPISTYYSGLGNEFWSTFPGWAYREFDEDDVTLATHDPHRIAINTLYCSCTELITREGKDPQIVTIVESEWGFDYGFLPDAIPQDWENLILFDTPGFGSW